MSLRTEQPISEPTSDANATQQKAPSIDRVGQSRQQAETAQVSSAGSADVVESSSTSTEGGTKKQLKLRSLAPEFKGDHHSLYVRHLAEAVKDKRNRNVALTGRYGAGKSSVLDAFEEAHRAKTVRISINTLGPDDDDEDLTNRIQKELVKQLVYRLEPGQIRRSRFARPKPITKKRAFWQAFGVSAVALTMLWLLGVRPSDTWPGVEANIFGQLALGLLFVALVVLVLWAVRWLIGDRFISEVSTAGTKIALSDGPTTYFDSFLDEIVSFFDAAEPKYVIFEDLDRFDDPQIFDSLRELNTLINASAHWKGKDQPLRFIYAIKDSLFEQLGADPALSDELDGNGEPKKKSSRTKAEAKKDLAAEAVRRANRTKFFEAVIPIVPFLSHRNARDHLADALEELGFPQDFVSRRLLDLVARHTTDMRLMINICNEFAVFVERLLWVKNPAPGMTADHLFALVVYKNFHMEDFENIAQRTSTLDTLEQHHREDVRALIKGLQLRRRARTQIEESRRRRESTVSILGQRLQEMSRAFPNRNDSSQFTLIVGGKSFAFSEVQTMPFWEQVAATPEITVSLPQYGRSTLMDEDLIHRLFPELNSAEHWQDPDVDALARETQRCDDDIASLRGASFVDLAAYSPMPEGSTSFEQRIKEDLKSELARDLVRKDFITLNFAEYSGIFYGSFLGVDVASFYNRSVQPNEMYLDFRFTTPNAVRNLLEQVPSDFASTVSALNLDVIDYLLSYRPAQAKEVAQYIASHGSNDDVQAFLSAFFNTPDARHGSLAARLAAHPWRSVLDYIAGNEAMPNLDTRVRAFDAALLHAQNPEKYELGDQVTEFLAEHHSQLTAVSDSQDADRIDRVFEILQSVGLIIPDLGVLSIPLRKRVVAAHTYEISVANMKLALDIDVAPTLDEIKKRIDVWEHVESKIDEYLKVMKEDSSQPLVDSVQVLIDVVNEQDDDWTDDQLQAVINGSDEGLRVAGLEEVPERLWPMFAESLHIRSSATNVAEYVRVHGVDASLAALLSPEGSAGEVLDVDELDDDARAELAVALLNAAGHLSVADRVALTLQIEPEDGIDLTAVTPSGDQLLARGLEAGLFEDDIQTFTHFAAGGWSATSEAFEVSKHVGEFMSPAIVNGAVAEFLLSQSISPDLKRTVLDGLSAYIPTDDARALRAAGETARAESFKLPIDQVRRIAGVPGTVNAVMRQLVLSSSDLSDDETVEILAALGEPYSKLIEGPGASFDFPSHGSSTETVFKRLELLGVVKLRKKHIGFGRIVEVLV